MDLIFVLVLALVLCLRNTEEVTEEEEILEQFDYHVMKRETKLNDTFFDDPKAFRRLVDELGFH